MSITFSRDKDTLVLKGDLDRFNLSDASVYQFLPFDKSVNVDLQQVKNIDTAGVAYLIKLVGHYQKLNKTVSVAEPSPQLIALAKISNVLELLPISNK